VKEHTFSRERKRIESEQEDGGAELIGEARRAVARNLTSHKTHPPSDYTLGSVFAGRVVVLLFVFTNYPRVREIPVGRRHINIERVTLITVSCYTGTLRCGRCIYAQLHGSLICDSQCKLNESLEVLFNNYFIYLLLSAANNTIFKFNSKS